MSTLTDLGPCGAFTDSGRCPGRLQVTGSDDVLVVGCCPLCGCEAALPVGKARTEPDPGPARWWDER